MWEEEEDEIKAFIFRRQKRLYEKIAVEVPISNFIRAEGIIKLLKKNQTVVTIMI